MQEQNAVPRKRFVSQISRYKYIIIAVVAVVLLVLVWGLYRWNVNNAWAQAIDYHSRSDYDQAYEVVKDLSVPSDPQRLEVYSQTMLATKHLDEAGEGYQKLYESKQDPFHKLIIGNIKNEQGDKESAIKTYEELIAANPNYVQAYVNLATLYKTQANQEKAVEVATQGRENNPQNVVLNELLVSLLLNEPESRAYREAVDQLKKLNPNDPLLETINEN